MSSKSLRRKNGQFSANWEKKVSLALMVASIAVSIPNFIHGSPKPAVVNPQAGVVQVIPVVNAKSLEDTAAPVVKEKSVEDLIIETFGDKWRIAYAVARAESGLREDAIGDYTLDYRGKDGNVYGMSLGVFQIRYLPGRPKVKDLLTAKFNIEYAYKMSKGGTDWSPWSAYKNNSYKQFLKD